VALSGTGTTSAGPAFALSASTSSNHGGAIALQGATLSGNVYIFTSSAANLQNSTPTGATRVCYWLDNPSMSGAATHCESFAPYDYAGSANNNTTSLANPWNTGQTANGSHTLTQAVTLSAGGTEVDSAAFNILNLPAPTATFSASLTTIPPGGSTTLTWSTTNTTSVSIDNGIGTVVGSGSATAAPTVNTTYTLTASGPGGTITASLTVIAGGSTVQHYEYVFPDQNMYVYDLDNNFALLKHISIPQAAGIRGVAAAPGTHMLYIAYGGTGGSRGTGSLLKFDLLNDTVVWTRPFAFGVDSFAISPDGATIYMPDGENSGDGIWYVLDADTGDIIGNINTGPGGPHNTIVSLDGAFVFMGPLFANHLVQASTSTNAVVRYIGPLNQDVRPFTINGKNTLAFDTSSRFGQSIGFQVSDIATGAVLYTVTVPGFNNPSNSGDTNPTHGISLSPDEREIYLIDRPNRHVHVFDVSGLPGTAPSVVANIPLTTAFTGNESPCFADCGREGWLRHTRDGRFVLVGDSGNVIDTTTRQVTTTIGTMYNTRKFLEIHWQNGLPIFTTTRYGLGYVTQ
jgi:hypothetical protein